MGFEIKANKTGMSSATPKRLVLAASIVALFCGFTAPVYSADMETLLDKLREKGILSEEEYQEMRTEARAERRQMALEKAKEEEKKTKKAESAPSELTGRFKDGFSWESGDKQHSIGLAGRIQADYRTFSDASGSLTTPIAPAQANSADTFDIRRAYLGVYGKLYDDWTFEVVADFAQSTNVLDVAWINYGRWKPVQFRIGQFKMPFSLEENTSSRFIDFQVRGLLNALVPGKERGFMVHGSPTTGLYYGVALSNGQGKNNNEPNAAVDDKDYIGRLAANFAEMIGNKDMILHLGAAYTQGTLPVAAAPSARTEARGLTFFIPAAFTGIGATGIQEMDRKRKGAELALAWKQFKLQSEWVTNKFSGTSNGGVAFDPEIDSYYAYINWLITGEKYADAYGGGVFRAIKPNQPFKMGTDGWGWGAWELGARYSVWDAGDFATTNAAGTGVLTAGTTNKAKAFTVGLIWIPNTNTRVYLNLIKTDFDTPVVVVGGTATDEKAITLRTGVFF